MVCFVVLHAVSRFAHTSVATVIRTNILVKNVYEYDSYLSKYARNSIRIHKMPVDDGSYVWEKSVADCFYSDGTMTVKYLIPKTIIVHGGHGSQMTSDTQHTAGWTHSEPQTGIHQGPIT